MPDPPTPHDALFKFVFSEPEHARSLLRELLPADLGRRVDWATLQVEPGSLVDARLRERHSDLLFSVRLARRKAFVFLLLEHQSEPDRLMPFRMLAYMVRVWERHLKDQPRVRRLPIVVPVVVHHGKSGWTSSTELHSILDAGRTVLASVRDHVPRFRIIVDDLARVGEDELFRRALTALARAALLLLRNARSRTSRELLDDLTRWRGTLLEVLAASSGGAAYWALMRYTLASTEVEPKEIQSYSRLLSPHAEETTMTGLEQLLKEGRAEGKLELLVRQLTRRFGPLPEAIRDRLHHATAEDLDRMAECVLTAASPEDVVR